MEERKNNMSISDILSRAFNLCKYNFVEIIKAIGVFILPVTIIQIIINKVVISDFSTSLVNFSINQDPYYLEEIINNIDVGLITILGLLYFAITILSLFGYLVITKIIDSANKGEEVTWILATKSIWKKKWRLLGLNILVWIMFIMATIVYVFLSMMITIITLLIGLIAIIPLSILLFLVLIPLVYVFTSMLIVGDLGVIDSIKETFLLFRRGYFWSTIGKFAAISCIYIGLAVGISIISIIPIIGDIVYIIGAYAIGIYILAYLNVFVLDRIKPSIYNFGKDNTGNNSGDDFIDPII